MKIEISVNDLNHTDRILETLMGMILQRCWARTILQISFGVICILKRSY